MVTARHTTPLLLVGIIGASLTILAVAGLVVTRASRPTPTPKSFLDLPQAQRKPHYFEPYLAAHPDDMPHREAALVWYNRGEPDDDKLKAHTLEMARRHPGNIHVYFENGTLFYLDPGYRQEVTGVLEAQIEQHSDDREFLWLLAKICEHNSIPRKFADPADRESWLHYYGLPPNYQPPRETDHERAEKAIGYYRQAIAAAQGEEFYPAFYAEQLADLLMGLERYDEALATCEAALPNVDEISRPGLYLTYGECLWGTDRVPEAKAALREVLAAKGDGFSDGPGCDAAKAHLLLGRIALGHDQDVKAAKKHLLEATTVQPCCHTTTQGMPLTLARELLEKGESEAVAKFCQTVLHKFIRRHKPTEELLRTARGRADQS